MSRRLPRFAYWLAGAALACGGAFAARILAEHFPPSFRVPIWLTGGALIFIGLAVLSLGTHHRQLADDEDSADATDTPAVIEAPRHPRRGNGGNGNDSDADGNGGNGGNGD